MQAGRPTRLELYGLAFATIVMFVCMTDNLRRHSEFIWKITKDLEHRPAIIQTNNQSVTVESERSAILKHIQEQRENENAGRDQQTQ